jgi:hypothetical protein
MTPKNAHSHSLAGMRNTTTKESTIPAYFPFLSHLNFLRNKVARFEILSV